jgi:hypothetical protein
LSLPDCTVYLIITPYLNSSYLSPYQAESQEIGYVQLDESPRQVHIYPFHGLDRESESSTELSDVDNGIQTQSCKIDIGGPLIET